MGTHLRPTCLANARTQLDKYKELKELFSQRNHERNWRDLSEREKREWIKSVTRRPVEEVLFIEDE